jgi:hypothetical protein
MLALLSFRLLLRLTADRATSFAGMLLVLINPVLLFRRFHLSLCAHWMIVAALLLYVAPQREHPARDRAAALALLVVACGTHPYLAVMVLGIVCAATCARSTSCEASLRAGRCMAWPPSAACGCSAIWEAPTSPRPASARSRLIFWR